MHLPARGRGRENRFRWESERRTDGDSGRIRLKCWQEVHIKENRQISRVGVVITCLRSFAHSDVYEQSDILKGRMDQVLVHTLAVS